MAAVVATLTLLAPSGASARKGCQSRACVERVARKHCSQRRVIPCIQRAALHWRVDFDHLVRRAHCESTLNPYAIGGPNRGLFQFNWPGTWSSTPYGQHDVLSAKWNALAAAWMEHVGRGGEWACR